MARHEALFHIGVSRYFTYSVLANRQQSEAEVFLRESVEKFMKKGYNERDKSEFMEVNMKNIRSVIKTLIVIFGVLYFLIVAVVPITFVIGTTDGGTTLQNYFGFVFEFFTWITPVFLFLLFAVLLLKAYLLYRHSEISKEKFMRQSILFSILILLQIILLIGMIVWADNVLRGNITAIE